MVKKPPLNNASASGYRARALGVLILLLAVAGAQACTIPVFRYALERWGADSYALIVAHDAPLSEDQQAIVEWLRAASSEQGGPANILVQLVDLGAEPDRRVEFPRLAGVDASAWMVLRYPGTHIVAWSAPLDADAARAVVDSPLRRDIAKRILQGETAVWILVECGDATRDNAAAERLQAALAKASEEVHLEQPGPDDPGYDPAWSLESSLELKVAFSMVRLKRDQPEERVLTSMLLQTESDLSTAREPIAFPIFGRARSLLPLVGKGISQRNVVETCAFLVGWCSCQAKELNPGVDLPVATDWDAGLTEHIVRDPELPELLPGMAGAVLPESLSAPTMTPPASQPSEPPRAMADRTPKRILLWSIGAIAGALLLLGLVAVWWRPERRA
jgi:hypothetical protein